MSGGFGILYLLSRLIGGTVSGLNDVYYDNKSRIDSKDVNLLTYRDHNGALRLVSNKKQVTYGTDWNGDRILKEVLSGKTVVNYDKKNRLKEIEEKNKELKEKNIPLEYLGKRQSVLILKDDVYPGQLCYLGKNNSIYEDKDGNKYVRLMFSYIDKDKVFYHIYINLKNGTSKIFEKINKEDFDKWDGKDFGRHINSSEIE